MTSLDKSVLQWNSADGKIIACNEFFAKKYNALPCDIIGKHIDQLETDYGVQIACLNCMGLVQGETRFGTLVCKTNDGVEYAEPITVRALSVDGQHVSEIQLNDVEDLQREKFRVASDALLRVFTDTSCTDVEKKLQILDIGLSYLSMQSGVVGSVFGHSLEIDCVSGQLAKTTQSNDQIPLHGDVYQKVLEANQVITSNNLADHQRSSDTRHVCTNFSSFIGTQVSTINGPLGIISFFSNDTPQHRFISYEKKFIRLLADWIGVIIGNEEQLEFVNVQTDHYQSLFRSLPAMMMLCDQHGLIISTSDRLSSNMGIDPLAIPGKNCRQFFIEEHSEFVHEALRRGDVDRVTLALLRADGRSFDVELSSSVKNIGSMQGMRMIVLVDVSERNQAMIKIEEQNKLLEHANHSLNQFTSFASHDLQQPLNNIQQFSGFLHEDMYNTMDEESRYHLDVIVNSAKKMKTFIQDLLKLSSAAKGSLVLDEIDLNKLLKDVHSEFQLRITESNAKVVIADLPKIKGEESLVRQLFSNLVSNSLKYRDENRDPLIQIACAADCNRLSITVRDNGIGFDQTLADQVFEPFSRLKTEKDYDGNGIGLSICATVCDKHDWKISVESQLGVGSVFTIVI